MNRFSMVAVSVVLCWPWHCSLLIFSRQNPSEAEANEATMLWSIDLDANIPKDCDVADLSLAKDRRLLAIAYSNGIYIWDLKSRSKLRHFKVPNPRHMTFSADGRMLAMFQKGGELNVWELASGRMRMRVVFDKDREHFSALEWNCSGDRLVMVCGNGKKIKLFDTNAGKVIRVFPEQMKQIWCLKFSDDDKTLTCYLLPDTLVQLNAETGEQMMEVALKAQVELNVDWSIAAITRNDARQDRYSVELYDVEQAKKLSSIQEDAFVVRTTFSPDNRWLAVAKSIKGNNVLSVWDIKAKKRLFDLVTEGDGSDHWTAFSNDCKYLFTMPANRRRIDVWQLPSGK